MKGHVHTQEDTRYIKQEILPRTRPPEENPTTMQDAPNRWKDHIWTETNQNNRQDPVAYAEDDVIKVFLGVGGSVGLGCVTGITLLISIAQCQETRIDNRNTTNTLDETEPMQHPTSPGTPEPK